MRKRQRIDSWLVKYGIYALCAVIMASSCATVVYAQRVAETNDETAMAIPRLVLPGSDRIDFPQPLSPSDVALVRHILDLQSNGEMSEADREIVHFESDWMVGPILAARYLNPNTHPTAGELSNWLRQFGEQSDSAAIAVRLRRIDSATATVRGDSAVPAHRIAAKPARGYAGPGTIRSLFSHNRDAEAIAAGQILVTSSDRARSTDDLLTAGLAAWRQNDKATAAIFFAAAYGATQIPAARAAAAYWMAHASEINGQPGESSLWLRRAALAQDTFYGRVARRKLGLIHAVDTESVPQRTIGAIDFDRLLSIPRARRAFGLLQIGDRQRAEDELRALSLDMETEPSLERLLVAVADAAGMPHLAEEMRTGYSNITTVAEKQLPPKLRPDGGFIVDPTLVYGIVHHESNFHTDVVSSLGARGLMQIMPDTARGIGALTANQAGRLAEPAVNLSVGQRYIIVLANDPDIHGDLLRLLAAYGQGQGAMKRWVASINDGGDPLMFLEAVPSPVLRAFLFDALASSWRYAVALRLPAPSLDALAEGYYPVLSRPVSAALSGASGAQAARSGYLARARY
jgi:soluble lytic murein transglycosylase